MAKLHILSGAQEGQIIELTAERITVGREPNNVLCLAEGLVSSYHAVFLRDGTRYRLRDLNSTNQTRVNGRPITEHQLHNGDRLQFGLVEIRYEAEGLPAPEPVRPMPVLTTPAARTVITPVSTSSASRWISIGTAMLAVVVVALLLRPRHNPVPAPVQKPTPVATVVSAPVVSPAVVHIEPKPAEKPPMTSEPVMVAKPEPEPPAPMPAPTPVPVPVEEEPKTMATMTETNPPSPAPEPAPAPEPEKPAPKPVPEKPAITNTPTATPAPVPAPTPATSTRTLPGGKLTIYETRTSMMAQNPIDPIVFGQLRNLKIVPANVCSDAVFVRRVFLDVIGTLPTLDEAREFLEDKSPGKRSALIDRLLARDEFPEYWAMKWGDLLRIKAEFPVNLWPNAVQTYHHWVRTCLRDNVPYDQFVRQLLTSNGSNFRVAPVNFYRAMQSRDPEGIAHAVALTLMGARAEKWPSDRQTGLAAFFSQVGYKSTAEWKEDIVFWDPGKATNNLWQSAIFPDGTPVELKTDRDPREVFADWLISAKNPWFTENIVNRIWSWLLGRGIIHEPDDIRPDNPPSNPELLAFLQREFVLHQYDFKYLYRLILNSKTYQLSVVPQSANPVAEANFAFYPLRRLDAEVLIDALNEITGTTERYSSPIPEPFTYIPDKQRAIELADASVTSSFLELFGRSQRATGLESERNNRPTAAQWLHLLNSSHIENKIERSQKLQALASGKKNILRDTITNYYLTFLSRYPTEDEVKITLAYAKSNAGQERDALVDLAWALLNSEEFLYRH